MRTGFARWSRRVKGWISLNLLFRRRVDPSQYPFLYRAISRKRYVDKETGEALADAFFRMGDEDSLSVILSANCSKEVCDATLRTCFGEFVLETQQVMELGLRVICDSPFHPKYSANHANIFMVPFKDDDPQRADDLATELAAISKVQLRPGVRIGRNQTGQP